MEEPSLYIPDGDGYVGTHLIQGGWNPDEANGAMVLALLGHCLEDVPSLVPMTISRLTADLMRPVPLGKRLQVSSSIVREGKKIQVVELLLTVDDVVHVRASVLRLREADLSDLDVPPSTSDARPGDALTPLEESRPVGEGVPVLPGFMHAVDMRRPSIIGGTGEGTWLRLVAPVVAGEPIRATSRLVVGFDFANLIGVEGHPGEVTMINPDVTGHVLRPPVGEWVGITGETRFNPAMGRGLSWASLNDVDGVFAVVSISQLIQTR